MKGWIGKILVTLLGIGLLVYSATRSIDFISLTLPADRQVLAYFGLAALDGGIVVWLLCFQHGSHGGAQRGIALMMILVDFLGAVAMFTADTIYNTGQAGLTKAFDQNQMMTFVLALSVIIALNIGAGLAFHITDPEHLRKMAEEEAIGRIEDKARKQVEQNSENLAAELAPIMGAAWVDQTRARALAGIRKGHTLGLPSSIVIDGEAKDLPLAMDTAPVSIPKQAAPVQSEPKEPAAGDLPVADNQPAAGDLPTGKTFPKMDWATAQPTAPAGYQWAMVETPAGWQMVLMPNANLSVPANGASAIAKNGHGG